MPKVAIRFAESAIADLESIQGWYAGQGVPAVGERLLGEIVASIEALADHRRHIGSFFALDAREQAAMLEALNWARAELARLHHPDSFNIGLNDGPAAGQTVPHCHLHLIPRYAGDVADPRGGVRWIIPGEARYWMDPSSSLPDVASGLSWRTGERQTCVSIACSLRVV